MAGAGASMAGATAAAAASVTKAPARRGVAAWLVRLLLRGLGVAAVACVGKLLALYLRVRRMQRMLAGVPQARYQDDRVLGGLKDFISNKDRLHDWRDETTRGLPVSKLFGLCVDPTGVILMVRDPQCIKHFLKDNFENYTKPHKERDPIWRNMNIWLGGGIFTIRHGLASPEEGKDWAKQRKIGSTIFSRTNFNNNMHAVFAAKVARLREVLATPAAEGQKVDMQKYFFSFTMDSIMQIFFGEKADTMGGATNVYGDAYDAAHNNFVQYIFESMAFLKMAQVLPWPVGHATGLVWKLHEMSSPTHKKFLEAVRTLDSESVRLVAACRADPGLAERNDLLALFVQLEDKERFSTKFLRDVVLNFIIAGRDTTACALSWMFYILATQPEVQAKLCEEIDQKCPRGSVPTFKQLSASEMPYLNGVLYETFRLYPPVPSDSKATVQDDVLPDGTPVPAGVELIFHPYAMGRDPERYPDPLAVRPERWIPFVEPQPHEFPVFQAGPRICLGRDMAVFEAKLVACLLLQEYTFELSPGEAERITYNITLTMSVCNAKEQASHNLWLIPKKRHC